jgi:hypothetical protein
MTLTRLTPAALLGVALLAAPAFGQTAEDIKKLNEKLDALTTTLQAVKDGMKTDSLREKVSTIDAKIDLIDQDIKEIKKDLRELKRKVDSGTTTALRPEFDSAAARGMGRVRFINEIGEEISVMLNGRAYRLLPGQERQVAVSPGEFTYQVLNFQRTPQVRQVQADETKNIRIYPLP